jgi:hypothetical protein
MNELAILGIGALTPAGAGWTGLTPTAPLALSPLPSLRRPDVPLPALRVEESALQAWSREPRLRRASRITLMMAEAARQALGDRRPKRLGIVGAFFTGPCHFSRRFFEPVIARGSSFASPALFPETVYNSSLSHLANLFGVDGACYAMVGDDSAWVSALEIASIWLDLDQVDAVLVVGGEELDVSALEAYDSAGWLKDGFIPSEGAAALLVARPSEEPAITIDRLTPPFSYRSAASARNAIAQCRAAMADAPVAATAGGTWMQSLVDPAGALPSSSLGHAFTASAGWHTLQGLRTLRDQPAGTALWVPVWGLHHQVAALRLRSSGCPQLAVFAEAR